MSETASVIIKTAKVERRSGRTSTRSIAAPKPATNRMDTAAATSSGRWP